MSLKCLIRIDLTNRCLYSNFPLAELSGTLRTGRTLYVREKIDGVVM